MTKEIWGCHTHYSILESVESYGLKNIYEFKQIAIY